MRVLRTVPAARRPSRITRAAPVHTVRVLGVDASLTSTGYAYRDRDQVVAGSIPTKNMSGPARLEHVLSTLAAIVDRCKPTFIVLEDYAKGKGGMGRTFDIGELGGVIKHYFYKRGIDVMLVSPTTLKMAITGRGNADAAKKVEGRKTKIKDKTKPEMRAALRTTFGIITTQGDAADAAGLMLLGEMRQGSTTVPRSVQAKLRLHSLSECVIIQSSQRNLKLIAAN
jgi:Holliday junction resolvasome RuvABC endonuclease subunit